MASSRPPLRGLRVEIKAYFKLYGRVVAELADGTAMADLRSVIGLLYRADWTRLSMSAGGRFAKRQGPCPEPPARDEAARVR